MQCIFLSNFPNSMKLSRFAQLLCVGVCLMFFSSVLHQALADGALSEYVQDLDPAELVPGADRVGTPAGAPPIAPVYKSDDLIGYIYLNTDFVDATGYSGKPIHILVGLGPDGTILGSKLVEHHEPIVLIGIPQRKIEGFLGGYNGVNAFYSATKDTDKKAPDYDIVSGATVTVMVMGDSLMRSALRAYRQITGETAQTQEAREQRVVDGEAGEVTDWQTLLGNGAIRRMHLHTGEINSVFADDPKAAKWPLKEADEDTFIDLYMAVVSQPAIGKSLLGEEEFAQLQQDLKPGYDAVLITAGGPYSFKGSGYVRGGIFDRIELIQRSETVRFHDRQHRRLGRIAAEGAPEFKDVDVFIVPDTFEFNAAENWSLKLLVQRQTGALSKAFRSFTLDYRLPDQYVQVIKPVQAQPEQAVTVEVRTVPQPQDGQSLENIWQSLIGAPNADSPLWVRIWQSKLVSISILGLMLVVVTAIFFFQDFLVKRPVLFDRIRMSYLVVTLVWLGWVAHAQLSVVNILAFFGAVRSGFQWSTFLVDPLIFILWFSVAAALLFWGRGPFCGWLCPFGALQELSNRLGRLVKLPQIKVPWYVHERLWPLKYIIFMVLFGVSLTSLSLAEKLSEIEPFKTAIILQFMREWWFVLFAVSLILAGLFIERFFCRYLCPLGAALAIPGRLRMFEWLKRYRDCGNPCMRCYNDCPVQAIHPEGHINPNECISCLNCQVLYHDDRKCPVVIQRRLKRERREALSSSG